MATKSQEIDNYRAAAVVLLNFKKNTEGWVFSEEFFVRNVPWRIGALSSGPLNKILFSLSCMEVKDEFSINAEIKVSILGTKLQSRGIQVFKAASALRCDDHWYWIVPKAQLPEVEELTFELKLTADEPEGIEYEPPKKKLKLALQPVESKAQDDDLASLLMSGEFSDVTFVVGENRRKVKAHKNILAARSKVFARMLACDMKEARDGEIAIDDMGAPALKMLLRYIYSGLLEFPKEFKVDIELSKELINAADKYDLQNLKDYAAMALTEFVSIENAVELLRFVKLHNAEAATNALRSYIVRNINEIVDKL